MACVRPGVVAIIRAIQPNLISQLNWTYSHYIAGASQADEEAGLTALSFLMTFKSLKNVPDHQKTGLI